MINTGRTIPYSSSILSRTAFTACMFTVSPILTDVLRPDMGIPFILGFYVLAFVLQRIMAGRGVSAAIYWVINTVIAAASFYFCRGCGFWMVCGIFISGLLAPRNIGRQEILLRIDLTVGCICLFAFLASTEHELILNENVSDTLMLLLASLALLLFSMVAYGFEKNDAPERNAALGKAGIAAFLAILVGLVSAFIKAAGSGMQSFAGTVVYALKSLYLGFVNAVAYVFALIWKFLMWISSFGRTEDEVIDIPPTGNTNEMIPAGEEITVSSPLWFKILLAVLAIALIVFVLKLLSKKRISTSRTEDKAVKIRRQSEFFKTLKRVFVSVYDGLSYRIFCITRRNTVPGLVSVVEKRVRLTRKQMARKKYESPQAFLRRLAESDDSNALYELADLCELHFYGGQHQKPSKELIWAIKDVISYK